MSTKSIHSVLPIAAMVISIPAIAIAVGYWLHATAPYDAPAGSDVFAVAQGVWTWTTSDSSCRAVHHTISFSPDHRIMYYKENRLIEAATGTKDSLFIYDVLSYSRHSIRAAMRGETRRTSHGDLVVWDLVLRSPDTYAWRQSDWLTGLYTARIRRCTAAELHGR